VSHPSVLIGIDGGTFSILDPMMAAGEMPHLRDLVARGARAELLSTSPAITPTAWTSLMTGRSPGEHGVMDFVRCEGRSIELTTSRHNACETIWSIAGRSGLRVGVLNFPQMHPPRPINGYSIPGWVTSRWMRMYSYPKGLIRRLRAETHSDLKELGMQLDEEAKAVEGCSREEYEDWVKLHIRRDKAWADVLGHLMRSDPCDLTAVIFDGMDRLQHQCWPFLSPAAAGNDAPPWQRRVQDLCLRYLHQLDSLVGEIVALAGPQANLFVASDHGFGPLTGVFHINAWLQAKGYLQWKSGAEAASPTDEGSANPLRSLSMIDWDHTRAFVPTGSCSGVYLAPDLAANSCRDDLLQELRAALLHDCPDPDSGGPLFTRVSPREEVVTGPGAHFAPDLMLEPVDGLMLSVRPSTTLLTRNRDAEVRGMHHRAGIFLACGPVIAEGRSLPPLSIVDVAPAVLYSLGVPIPEDLAGKLRGDLFRPEALATRPPTIGEATHPPEDSWAVAKDSSNQQDQRDVAARLRALGYID